MKIVASVEGIRAEMQRRINTSTWGKGYCADCSAPFPYRIPHDGIANWAANVAAMAKPGCEGFLLDVIASVREEYDLPSQSLGAVITDLLAGGRRF
jgi:hypothetical protein